MDLEQRFCQRFDEDVAALRRKLDRTVGLFTEERVGRRGVGAPHNLSEVLSSEFNVLSFVSVRVKTPSVCSTTLVCAMPFSSRRYYVVKRRVQYIHAPRAREEGTRCSAALRRPGSLRTRERSYLFMAPGLVKDTEICHDTRLAEPNQAPKNLDLDIVFF